MAGACTKQGLMAHNDGFPLFSRDWANVDCRAEGCEWSRSGSCSVPSLAVIGEDGRCKGFKPKGTFKPDDERVHGD